MSGRAFVTPDDVQELAEPVLCHRFVLSADAAIAGRTAADILAGLLAALPVPPAREALFERNDGR